MNLELSLSLSFNVIKPNSNRFPGDHSRLEPPDPIPNSEVKRMYADDSVGSPHVKVGHRQGFICKCPETASGHFFYA